MSVYYNEIDPYCAAWLQNLMDAGQIPHGVIDTRSIEDVRPDELAGFTQCHFFAGLGGWSYALRLAGWGTRPVWSGSCPCQPFSAAGKGSGFADQRHLWPAWFHLIRQCRPPVVFGEQVASAAVGPWVDLVHADVEGMGYAFGCVPFPAAGVRAPHIRDRSYWVAVAIGDGSQRWLSGRTNAQRQVVNGSAGRDRTDCEFCGYEFDRELLGRRGCPNCGGDGLAEADGRNPGPERQQRGGEHRQQPEDGRIVRMANADRDGCGARGTSATTAGHGHSARATSGDDRHEHASAHHGGWDAADWLRCRDGKWRPVEPGTFPLAHGIPNRVGRLRAYGNAIVPQAAAEFIRAFLDVEDAQSVA